jgi:hypothetical protein
VKRIAFILSIIWLVLVAMPGVAVSAKGRIPANHTRAVAAATHDCCPDGCTCCEGGTCTCADASCKCCKDGACDMKKCDKKCDKKSDKQCEKACTKMHEEKK